MVEREAQSSLAKIGLGDAPRFSVPMPFNTLLWRVVAMTPEGFVEGERSLVADRGPIRFTHFPSDTRALDAVRDAPQVARLLWFNHHFAKAHVRDGKLVLSDLRMGSEPDYSFRFAVAEVGWRRMARDSRAADGVAVGSVAATGRDVDAHLARAADSRIYADARAGQRLTLGVRAFAWSAGWIVQTGDARVAHARAVVDVSVQPPVVRRADEHIPLQRPVTP